MTTENQPIQLEDLDYFWTKSGVPCFMANRENIEQAIESLGFTIYYLICNVAEDRKIENKTWEKGQQVTTTTYLTDLSTKIVKVVNNFVGRSVNEIKDEDIYDFEPVREGAVYNLPPIPREIVDKLDEFFRLVDAQHGTESIVLLTFDPNFTGSSAGWGVLVPDQVNTSVHCKYDPDSIVEQKPDHIMIVGSVHSHPNMAAYASGTDHADQADFDGLHITYGWQKSVNGGATQYHIEMQMNGSVWTLKPEDVFADTIFTKQPDPQVLEWSSKVKKVSPPQGGSVSPVQPHQTAAHTPQESRPTQPDYTLTGTAIKGDPRLQEHPDPKDPNPFIVVAEVDIPKDSNDLECPSCGSIVGGHGYEFVCDCCDILFALYQDSHSEILESVDRYLERRKMSKNINVYLWTTEEGYKEFLLKIRDISLDDGDSNAVSYLDEDNLDAFYYEGFNYQNTVCCNEPIVSLRNGECDCMHPVSYNDLLDFDAAHPYDIYERNGSCSDCEFYYSRACTPYLFSILEFARNGTRLETPINECPSFSYWNSPTRYETYQKDIT